MTTNTNSDNPNNNTNTTNTAPVGGGDPTSGGDPDKTTSYDKSFVDKLKGEKDNFKNRANQLEAELAGIKAQQKADDEKRMKDNNDFKALYENKNKEYEALQSKVDGFEKSKMDSKKTKALALELKKLGINEDYLEKASSLADLTKIKIDTETDAVYGADTLAKTVNEDWPALFGKGDNSNVTHSSPDRMTKGSDTLTMEQWRALPYDERVKREGELYK